MAQALASDVDHAKNIRTAAMDLCKALNAAADVGLLVSITFSPTSSSRSSDGSYKELGWRPTISIERRSVL